LRAIATVFLAALLAACASTSGGSTPGRQRNVISQQEIAESNMTTAYEIVESLRPEYLRSRGTASMRSQTPETAVVYIDGVRAGGLDALRQVSRDLLQEIRFLNGSDATTMYGTGHGGGAIQVITRRG
jgi:outer membrane cobalamin receptor